MNKIEGIAEDMDELEDDLFGMISKKKNVPMNQDDTLKSNPQLTADITKKVVFHDFNEDDPLADLLSDEEDFKTSPSTAVKGSLVSDLFGIKNTSPADTNTLPIKSQMKLTSVPEIVAGVAEQVAVKSDDWTGLSSISPKKVPDETHRFKAPLRANVSSDDGIASGIMDRTNNAGEKTKKSSLMEDLFGSRPKPNTSKEKFASKDLVVTGLEMSEIQKKSEELSKSNTTKYAPTLSAPREARRSRKSSSNIMDPLGLFSSLNVTSEVQSSEANEPKLDHSYSSKVKDNQMVDSTTGKSTEIPTQDLPEWLGGPKKSNEDISQTKKDADPSRVKFEDKSNEPSMPTTLPNEAAENKDYLKAGSSLDYLQNYSEHLSMLTGSQFDQQATMMSLQQQEHELRTAAILSRQSDQLNKMVESQRIRFNDQEKQFNFLIKRQIDRQKLLEEQMKLQQDRINSHLQVLLAQPTTVPFVSSAIDNNDLSRDNDEYKNVQNDFGNIIKKLEDEKLCFENILDRLQDQHTKEIVIIEESYSRQIELMNQGAEKLEKRLRQDVELAEADYEAKIQKMNEELENLKIAHGEELKKLKKEHAQHIQEILDQQHSNTQLLQNEYIETIKNISKAKEIEQLTVNNATTQTANLNDMLQIMKVTMAEINELKTKLEEKSEESNRAKELILKQQIEELRDLKEYLKKQHEALERDRKELTNATQKLDGGTSRLISEFDRLVKENIEAENRLKTREEKLMRDRELLDTQIQWERNHIQAMKETWIKEQERQAKQLSDERNSIAAERARLETLQRLKIDDNDTAKTELEAALSAAREASNLANQEKQKWRERLNEVQLQKQQIKEKENSLTLRAKELEDLTQSALEKREEGLRALKEARYLEEQHKAYLGQLKMQFEALVQRENKLAAEKLTLARERLASRMSPTDKPEKDISRTSDLMTHLANQHPHYPSQFNDLPNSQITTTHFKDIVDPQLVLLKLGLDNELDVTNDCLEIRHSIAQ